MIGTSSDRRALEREALQTVINQWNNSRVDLFALSMPNEDLEFHGVMRFYFQDSGQKVATKCIRVASDATVEDVIGTLVEKFRPDMRMLSIPSYGLYELHEGCAERQMAPDEKPLLVQLNWHMDDREGRFLLRNIDDKTVQIGSMGSMDSSATFKRKLSKRERKQLKKQEKLSRLENENGDIKDGGKNNVTEKLYNELPETSFTRSISNPEAVMRRRRHQKLEKKLQQFRSKDGGPDTGGTLKIYGEALCKDVPYKTLLLSIRDCAGAVVREMLDKYGLTKVDPSQFCLVQVTQQPGVPDTEYVLDDDECPLSILMTAANTGSIMFHVRRRPADCAPRKRKKKPGALGGARGDHRADQAPLLIELSPEGQAPHLGDANKNIRLVNEVMEVGSANGIALQLYGPHIQPRHCVIMNTDGVTSLIPCHADAHTYVNGQRIHQTTTLTHGSLVKFGNSNTYRFLDPAQEDRTRYQVGGNLENQARACESRSPRALSPTHASGSRENIETTFDIDGNVETISTNSGAREDNRSLGSDNRSENRLSGLDRYPRGQDPILPAVLEFPEEPQEQFLARVITHLDVNTPAFRLAPAYTLYLCARYRASTHYRGELTPTERAHRLNILLQHAAMLIRHAVQDRSTDSTAQAFWLANSSELLHFLKNDKHLYAYSGPAQETLTEAVHLAFKNVVACVADELYSAMSYLLSTTGDDYPREFILLLSNAMSLLRKCRVNAGLTIQLFSQLFYCVSVKALSGIISNSNLCTRSFGAKLASRMRNLRTWADSQGLEIPAESHLTKLMQCAHLLQAPKYTPEDLANLSPACFKLNSIQLGTLLMQYKAEPGEKIAPPSLLEQAAKAAETVADELVRAEGREVTLYDERTPPMKIIIPEDGFSCDVVQGVPLGLGDFLHPLQAAGLCRLAVQPTSSGHWTVYMPNSRSPSALSAIPPEVQVIRLHKAGGGMGLSIVAAKASGQERLGVYIKSVVPGGAADKDGRLAAGDQLLSVDGQSLLGISQERAAEFLVRTGSVVTLEVAKGGAVYNGVLGMIQQPSPTPHRALMQDSYYDYYQQQYNNYQSPLGSEESLCSQPATPNFTPPINNSQINVFFNSDDSLFKTERRRLVIPRIEIQSDEPVFNLQVTDFSEAIPKNVTLTYDATGQNMETQKVEEFHITKPANAMAMPMTKSRAQEFAQNKSFSIDVNRSAMDIHDIRDTDKFLSIGTKRLARQQRATSTSLTDLSSSTSSINSCLYESNLDLSLIDPDTPIKHWRSPFEMRHGKDAERDCKSVSDPVLNKRKRSIWSRSKSVSEEQLNDKLTEFERMEILKLLLDWSLHGSESKSEFTLVLNRTRESLDGVKKIREKYHSEPNLSPPKKDEDSDGGVWDEGKPIIIGKYSSESKVASTVLEDDFWHKCQFRNCIFNINFRPDNDQKPKLKSILKNSEEKLAHDAKTETEIQNRLENLQISNSNFDNSRRNSEILNSERPLSCELIRCDSLERLTTQMRRHKKFPESYIVSKKTKFQKMKQSENATPKPAPSSRSPKFIIKKKCLPKTWKSCSDIKPGKPVKKCCRYAKKSCPIMKNCSDSPKRTRKVQSCQNMNDNFIRNNANDRNQLDQHNSNIEPSNRNYYNYKLTENIQNQNIFHSTEEQSKYCRICFNHDPFSTAIQDDNSSFHHYQHSTAVASTAAVRLDAAGFTCTPGSSACLVHRPRRMSERDLPSRIDAEHAIPSSKSVPALHQIHTSAHEPSRLPGGQPFLVDGRATSNNNVNNHQNMVVNGPAGLRSRSTHNLNQQDASFYQNFSVYRNKMPSPQQLGDRSSALRSSQNSLQSSITSPVTASQQQQQQQRPSSAYYPQNTTPNFNRPNLHQSIPNLKSPLPMHKVEDNIRMSSGGAYPTPPSNGGGYNQQQFYGQQPMHQVTQQATYRQLNQQQQQQPNYAATHADGPQFSPTYSNQNQSYPSPTQHNPPPSQVVMHQHQSTVNSNTQKLDENRYDPRLGYNNNGSQVTANTLLREDVLRQSQMAKHDEMIRYPSSNNVRISEAQIQNSRGNEELLRHQEMMRNSKSDEPLKHHQSEMMRYASSGNIRAQDMNQPLRSNQQQDHLQQQQRLTNEERILRGQAKMAEMGDEVRRRQQQQQQQPPLQGRQFTQSQYSPQMAPANNAFYQQQQQQQQHYYNTQMTQSMQNLSINHTYQNHQLPITKQGPPGGVQPASASYHPAPGYYANQGPTSPNTTYRQQNQQRKPTKREDSPPPALPPTSTHPLYAGGTVQADMSSIYTASNQDPPKMAFYPASSSGSNSKPPSRDPWAREEQERQQEARREAARQWQEMQIRELTALPYRTPQQDEQLRVLQLEREFQRRAQEAAGEDDEDTEKESPTPQLPQPVSSQTVISSIPSATVSSKPDASPQLPPTSILKTGMVNPQMVVANNNSLRGDTATNNNQVQQQSSASTMVDNSNSNGVVPPPPPPERGSSFAVMSMRSKEVVGKRVSFDTTGGPSQNQSPPQQQQQQPSPPQIPNTLPIETERVREDPNSFILQAESMLASPTTPVDGNSNVATATPGVIGAQEVYRDPRAKRLAEQQKKHQFETTPVPEKLSFKEKMKMFAMETGEQGTPKDKSKISRAQREIDNLASPPPSSGIVH